MRTSVKQLKALFLGVLAAVPPTAIVIGAGACGGASLTTRVADDGGTEVDARVVDASTCPWGEGSACCPYLSTLDGALPDANVYSDASSIYPSLGPGSLDQTECKALCRPNANVFGCTIASEGPPVVLSCQPDCTGRRPEGLRAGSPSADAPLAAHFAEMARLEAASVPAFRRMARELARFGAPRRFVRAAERAAREEPTHARVARALGRRFRAPFISFAVDVERPRSLEAFAIENAVEGCVRETFGALVATWQARNACDPQIRARMKRIAREETTHAALAWSTHAWVHARLDHEGRLRVDRARAEALAALVADVEAREPPLELARLAGIPPRTVASALARGLAAA